MTVSRRSFLKASSALALLPATQGFYALGHRRGGRRLVVIHLAGGNDGINTVVPHTDPGYARSRPTLRLRKSSLHTISDELALHGSLKDFKALWDDGQLTIVQGVGYPDASRSHFLSTAIWETAICDPQKHAGVGWLGRALDEGKAGRDRPTTDSIYIGTGEPPIALRGRRSQATNLVSLRDFRVPHAAELRRVAEQVVRSNPQDPRVFLSQVALAAYDAAERLAKVQRRRRVDRYPPGRLARQLELAATLIGNDHPAEAYYLTHAGYDTHSAQVFAHANLLTELSRSVRAFLGDIAELGKAEDVVVMMFSEFGRTLKENGSKGTDHGSAGPVFLAGTPVKGGLVGKTPSLTDLVDREPRWSIDFRRVYATVETNWLERKRAKQAPAHKTLDLFGAG